MKKKLINLYQLKHARLSDDYITNVIESDIKLDEHTVSCEQQDESLCDEYNMIKNRLIQQYIENHPEYDNKTINNAIEYIVRMRDIVYNIYDWHDLFDNDVNTQCELQNINKINKTDLAWGDNKLMISHNSVGNDYYSEEIKDCVRMIEKIMDGYDNYNDYEKHKADLDVERYKDDIRRNMVDLIKQRSRKQLYEANETEYDDKQEIINILTGFNDIIFDGEPKITCDNENSTYYIFGDGEIVIPFEHINKYEFVEDAFNSCDLYDVIRRSHDWQIDFDKHPIDIVERNYIYLARCKNIIVFVKHADYRTRIKMIDKLKKQQEK